MTDDKLAVSQEAKKLADELGTITEERRSIVLAALARFEAQARAAGERAGMEKAAAIALNHSNYGHGEGNKRAFAIKADIERRMPPAASTGEIG